MLSPVKVSIPCSNGCMESPGTKKTNNVDGMPASRSGEGATATSHDGCYGCAGEGMLSRAVRNIGKVEVPSILQIDKATQTEEVADIADEVPDNKKTTPSVKMIQSLSRKISRKNSHEKKQDSSTNRVCQSQRGSDIISVHRMTIDDVRTALNSIFKTTGFIVRVEANGIDSFINYCNENQLSSFFLKKYRKLDLPENQYNFKPASLIVQGGKASLSGARKDNATLIAFDPTDVSVFAIFKRNINSNRFQNKSSKHVDETIDNMWDDISDDKETKKHKRLASIDQLNLKIRESITRMFTKTNDYTSGHPGCVLFKNPKIKKPKEKNIYSKLSQINHNEILCKSLSLNAVKALAFLPGIYDRPFKKLGYFLDEYRKLNKLYMKLNQGQMLPAMFYYISHGIIRSICFPEPIIEKYACFKNVNSFHDLFDSIEIKINIYRCHLDERTRNEHADTSWRHLTMLLSLLPLELMIDTMASLYINPNNILQITWQAIERFQYSGSIFDRDEATQFLVNKSYLFPDSYENMLEFIDKNFSNYNESINGGIQIYHNYTVRKNPMNLVACAAITCVWMCDFLNSMAVDIKHDECSGLVYKTAAMLIGYDDDKLKEMIAKNHPDFFDHQERMIIYDGGKINVKVKDLFQELVDFSSELHMLWLNRQEDQESDCTNLLCHYPRLQQIITSDSKFIGLFNTLLKSTAQYYEMCGISVKCREAPLYETCKLSSPTTCKRAYVGRVYESPNIMEAVISQIQENVRWYILAEYLSDHNKPQVNTQDCQLKLGEVSILRLNALPLPQHFSMIDFLSITPESECINSVVELLNKHGWPKSMGSPEYQYRDDPQVIKIQQEHQDHVALFEHFWAQCTVPYYTTYTSCT